MIQETGANVLVLEQLILQMQIGEMIKMSSIRQIELRVGRVERVHLQTVNLSLLKRMLSGIRSLRISKLLWKKN